MGFMKPKMPAPPDPLEVARQQQQAEDEAKAREQEKMREEAASDAMDAERRRANRMRSRRNLVTSGDTLGVDQSFIGNKRSLL